jgi:hypothetical protein
MQELNAHAGWRWVCQLYLRPVPNFRTLQNREVKLTPKTIRLINQVVVVVGQGLGVTKAEKLRVDGSVTETNTRSDYPTDSSLLDDAARVLSRLVKQAREVVSPRSRADKVWFRDRHRQAHGLARDISRLTRSKAKNTGKSSLKLYGQLLAVVETLVNQVAEIQPRLAGLNDSVADGLNAMFAHNGLITNDKFCMSRSGRLTLSWSRHPLRLRKASDGGSAYPPNENSHCGGPYETPLASAPTIETQPGRTASLGSGLPTPSAMESVDRTGDVSGRRSPVLSDTGGVP